MLRRLAIPRLLLAPISLCWGLAMGCSGEPIDDRFVELLVEARYRSELLMTAINAAVRRPAVDPDAGDEAQTISVGGFTPIATNTTPGDLSQELLFVLGPELDGQQLVIVLEGVAGGLVRARGTGTVVADASMPVSTTIVLVQTSTDT